MLIRTVLSVCLLASSAHAAAFDDLKSELSSCLRHVREGARSQRATSRAAQAGLALEACAAEMDRLDRADGRRIRGDQGLSPSTWSVLASVFGRGGSGRFAGPPRALRAR